MSDPVFGGLGVFFIDILGKGLWDGITFNPTWKTWVAGFWLIVFILWFVMFFASAGLNIPVPVHEMCYIWLHMILVVCFLYWSYYVPILAGLVFVFALWHSWKTFGGTKGHHSIVANMIPFCLYFVPMLLYYTFWYVFLWFLAIDILLFIYSIIFRWGFSEGMDDMINERHGRFKFTIFVVVMVIFIMLIVYVTKIQYSLDRGFQKWRGI